MSIETTRNGQKRVRRFINGKRRELGIAATQDAAMRLERAALKRIETEGAETLAVFGHKWIDGRELAGLRGAKTYRGHWRTHVEGSSLGATAPALVTTALVKAWIVSLQGKLTASRFQRQARPLSAKSIKCIIAVLRLVLDAAHVRPNPVAELRDEVREATRRKGEAATREPWTYLDEAEQRALLGCEAIPEAERLIIAFALLTGVRQGEQMNLELRDVRLDDEAPHVVVRFGSKRQPPKNGRVRRVYLSPHAETVVRRWLEVLPTWCKSNDEGLLFPTRGGGRVCRGKTPFIVSVDWNPATRRSRKIDRFPLALAAAGITRRFRWHDLRHACASSLVAGWWGRRWTLDEVREHLGHTSILTTARYAHLGDSAIKRAAAETRATQERAEALPALFAAPEKSRLDRRGESSPDSLEGVGHLGVGAGTWAGSNALSALEALEALAAVAVGPLARRCRAALAAHEAGDPFAAAMMARLIEELLARLPKHEPAKVAGGGTS